MPRRYQEEPDIGNALWDQGFARPLQMFRISAWKSAKGSLAELSLAAEGQIEEVTGETIALVLPYRHARGPAVDDDDFWKATDTAIGAPKRRGKADSGLRSLPGVGLPMASAFLAILNGSVWPVIDVRALPRVLSGVPYRDPTTRRDVYQRYVKALHRNQLEHFPGISIHRVDQEAYGAESQADLPFSPEPW